MITWKINSNQSCPMYVSSDGSLFLEREFAEQGEWILKVRGFRSIVGWQTATDAKAALNTRKRIPCIGFGRIEILEIG